MPESPVERRSEPREILDKYYSVEFSIRDLEFVYQFKIWNKSSRGICVLVKEDSDLLNYIKIGDILKLKYYTTDSTHPVEYLKTQIKHISKDEKGRFKRLYFVGLSILESRDSKRVALIRVICPTCNASYKILSDRIVQGRKVVVTCKKCGDKIEVEPSTIKKR